jgi:hypothetical protein
MACPPGCLSVSGMPQGASHQLQTQLCTSPVAPNQPERRPRLQLAPPPGRLTQSAHGNRLISTAACLNMSSHVAGMEARVGCGRCSTHCLVRLVPVMPLTLSMEPKTPRAWMRSSGIQFALLNSSSKQLPEREYALHGIRCFNAEAKENFPTCFAATPLSLSSDVRFRCSRLVQIPGAPIFSSDCSQASRS